MNKLPFRFNEYIPTKHDLACNAIRDLFLSKQYERRVPVEDIKFILESPKWHKWWGKEVLQSAWKDLVKDGYVNGEIDPQTHEVLYVWGIEHNNDSGIRRN